MGLFSSGSKIITTTQKQSSTPWAEQVPHLKYAFEEAKKIYASNGPKYFPKPTVVPFCDETNAFLNKQQERAITGSTLNKKANNSIKSLFLSSFNEAYPQSKALIDTTKGDFLKKNPQNSEFSKLYKEFTDPKSNPAYKQYEQYVQNGFDERIEQAGMLFREAATQIKKQYEDAVFPKITSQFASKGKNSSKKFETMMGMAQEKLAKELKILAKDIYVKQFEISEQYKLQAVHNIEKMHHLAQQNQVQTANILNQNYIQERVHQLNAASQLANQKTQHLQSKLIAAKIAPLLAQQDYHDLSQLSQIGKMRENLAQAQLNDEVNRWNHKNSLSSNKLAHYIGLISGGYGGESLNSETQPYQREGSGDNFFGKIMQEALLNSL